MVKLRQLPSDLGAVGLPLPERGTVRGRDGNSDSDSNSNIIDVLITYKDR